MFVHPWAIVAGLAAVGLPLAVHWLTRPRPTRLPLSTIRFVREAVKHRRARHRLRDFLVLALRAAAVVLIALAVARPRLDQQPLVSDADSGSTLRVVILDVSQSMAAVDRGVSAIERARPLAAEHLRYRPGLRANLILAGARPTTVFAEPSQNFEAQRDELARATVMPQRGDVNRAIARAAEMLAPVSGADQRRRELVIVSDFQRSNWARADFSPLPPDTRIQLESVAPAGEAANVALLSARVDGRATLGTAAQLEVEIGNYTPTPRTITAEVTIADATYRLSALCPARQRTTLTREVSFSRTGWHTGHARLVGVEDALPADDRRPLAVRVDDQPIYALVTRQPRDSSPSASNFLAWALAPGAGQRGNAEPAVVRLDPAELDRQSLAPASVIVIVHPGKLSGEAVNLLAGLLRRGRPILYVASEWVDADNLRALSTSAGRGLQMPVEFAAAPQGQPRRDLFLTAVRSDLPPFSIFGDNVAATVERLRFGGGLVSRRLENTLDDDVLATFSDGSAGLVLTSSGVGSLAVLNADLQRSNLATSGAFVPLLDQLIEQMLKRQSREELAHSGEPLLVRLPPEVTTAEGLHVISDASDDNAASSGADSLGEFADEGTGVLWHWSSPARPGVYRVEQQGQTVFALPVAIPQEESRLEYLSADVLRDRLAGGRSVYFRSIHDADQQQDRFWIWAAIACVACMMAEVVALTGFRS